MVIKVLDYDCAVGSVTRVFFCNFAVGNTIVASLLSAALKRVTGPDTGTIALLITRGAVLVC